MSEKETMIVAFQVPGKPFGKQRPRVNTRTHRAYTPKQTMDYEKRIANAYRRTTKYKAPKDTPVQMTIYAYHQVPKSAPKKRVGAMLDDRILPTVKPDIDNIAKVVIDGLNKVAYEDDNQIVDLRVVKRYAKSPKIVVMITWEYTNDKKGLYRSFKR